MYTHLLICFQPAQGPRTPSSLPRPKGDTHSLDYPKPWTHVFGEGEAPRDMNCQVIELSQIIRALQTLFIISKNFDTYRTQSQIFFCLYSFTFSFSHLAVNILLPFTGITHSCSGLKLYFECLFFWNESSSSGSTRVCSQTFSWGVAIVPFVFRLESCFHLLLKPCLLFHGSGIWAS